MNEWLRMTDMTSDSDDDLDIDDNGCLIPTVQERNAATEPACDSDLTQFQAEVLRREDDANDQAIRDIIPDDCYTFVWSKNRETNRNAEQKIALLREQNMLAPHSQFNRWSPTDRDEIVSFLAIIILQGLYPLPEEEVYFTFNGFGTMAYFAKIMSYNRFLLLKTFLHFVDSQTCQDTTRLCKIRPVIDFFNDKFSTIYMPSQEIAIDESLLKWHGRLNFAQKISSNAAQVGVKTYVLCESSSGYLWKFFVYAGKDKTNTTTDSTDGQATQTNDRPVRDEAIDRFADDETNDIANNDGAIVASTDRVMTSESGDRPTSATAKIVYDLIEPLLHRGHTVIMDNFYNSPLLLRSLKKQKTDCYGTFRLNREFVPDYVKTLTKTDLRQGEVVATYCSDLAILVWRDANIVSMISTYHNLQVGTQDKVEKHWMCPKKTRTIWKCEECDVNLCIEGCFKAYHKP
ncbi:unnamed protein product [Parnassius mnemosyne]|uniref:PiggyBac transposable element-derived protein domain-containing protein n=1 Tax=Parnassius mnemosyne TaxID=213953 RepID=A0AAV1LLM2_9NEOP